MYFCHRQADRDRQTGTVRQGQAGAWDAYNISGGGVAAICPLYRVCLPPIPQREPVRPSRYQPCPSRYQPAHSSKTPCNPQAKIVVSRSAGARRRQDDPDCDIKPGGYNLTLTHERQEPLSLTFHLF